MKKFLRQPLLLSLRLIYQRAARFLAFCGSFLRVRDQMIFAWSSGSPTLEPRTVVFVHFDRKGAVQPYVMHYIRSLHDAGFSIFFTSNSEALQPSAVDDLMTLCAGVLVRRNIGYDFAAMREALRHFSLPRSNTELLILANDSVYGPLRSLDEMLRWIDMTGADIWGATDSWQSRYHLQSYFLAVGKRALQSPAWRKFWEQVRPVSNKSWVIINYEIGFTQWMIRAGLRCAAIWPYHELVRDVDPGLLVSDDKNAVVTIDPLQISRREHAMRIRGAYVRHTALNPTSDLWRQLLRVGFPFIKRELLRDNPAHVGDVVDWRMEVLRIPGADTRNIERDLQRLLINRAP